MYRFNEIIALIMACFIAVVLLIHAVYCTLKVYPILKESIREVINKEWKL